MASHCKRNALDCREMLYLAMLRAVPEIILWGRWAATVFLSGGWVHNNVKFVPRDEDIQVWWGQLVFRFILGVGVCAFLHVPGWRSQKKLPPTLP